MNAPSAAPLLHPFPNLPPPGTLLQVAPGVAWLRMPLPFALDHINLWLLDDDEGYSIVDTGYGVPATRTLWETIFAGLPAGRPIKRVIVTHYHPDHVGCADWLCQRWGVELWMTEAEFLATHAIRHGIAGYDNRTIQDHFRRHGLDGERLKAQETRGNAYVQGVPGMPVTYRRMIDGDDIAIGNRLWHVTTVYGHAPEHATLYSAKLGVLISGDQVLPKITTNVGVWGNQPEGNALKRFLDSIGRFEALPADTLVLPSHGLPFQGLHTRIEQLRAHHFARLAELEAACGEPHTAAELLPVLFRRPLDDHQMMFAMGEIVAHLNYLLRDGRLKRTQNDQGIYRFMRPA
jgi:glyoxylase-like metal-dependent hydrolase (beta-lactamase superfamily II)